MSDTEDKIIEALAPKIYDDTLQPAAREVGKSLGNVVRAALLPVSGIVCGQGDAHANMRFMIYLKCDM